MSVNQVTFLAGDQTQKLKNSPSPCLTRHLTLQDLFFVFCKIFTFNSEQKMAKSEASYPCEKNWKIRGWGTAKKPWKIGKIYCRPEWILHPMNINKESLFVHFGCVTPCLCAAKMPKNGIHLYVGTQFLYRRLSLPSNRDALLQLRHPSKWHSPIDSQVTRGEDGKTGARAKGDWENESGPSSTKDTRFPLGWGRNETRKTSLKC